MSRSSGPTLSHPEVVPSLEEFSKRQPETHSDQLAWLLETLQNGHPHQASKLADEAIGDRLNTVWKAARILRTDSPDSLNEELLAAALDSLKPAIEIVDALTSNREFCSSRGRSEGYRAISGRIDSVLRQIKSMPPNHRKAWDLLRQNVGELLDSMHLPRFVASNEEVADCRQSLLESNCDYLFG